MDAQVFDIAVIGSGPGGYPAAIEAAQRGAKVVLFEEDLLGGTCLNRGCIPSKALISYARMFHTVKNASSFGIQVGEVTADFPAMIQKKDQVVGQIRKGLQGLIQANGIHVVSHRVEFQSRGVLIAGGKSYQTKAVIIAAGSRPRKLPLFPCDGKVIHDSTSILNLSSLPRSLVVVGGGVIGCEFASLFHLLGVKVTIIEMLPRILSTECEDLSAALEQQFKRQGIEIKIGAFVEKVETQGKEAHLILKDGEVITAEHVLVAVGREVASDTLQVAKAGLSLEPNGSMKVDAYMQTKAGGIYAIGDVTGKWWLAHVATHQGVIAASNALGERRKFHDEAIPTVTFTTPEVASVGLSPEKAKEKGYTISVGRFPFLALGKAQVAGHPEGFAQVVIDSKTGQILGGQVIGEEASTLIGEMGLAVANELTAECIIDTIHAHPTLSEVWHEAVLMAVGRPLHLPPKRG